MIVFYSLHENTRRFVDKLDVESVRIPSNRDQKIVVDKPYILITPTYSGGRPPKPVSQFLNDKQNRPLMDGVIGAGNRGFGREFALAADVISIKCSVPLLYKFEIMGTTQDVKKIQEGIDKWWIQHAKRQITSN